MLALPQQRNHAPETTAPALKGHGTSQRGRRPGNHTSEVTAPVIRVGISASLLGTKVRSEGRHKRDPVIEDTFGRFFTWVPVCPEGDMGLDPRREHIQLVGAPELPHPGMARPPDDVTSAMQRVAARRLDELDHLVLHGFILQKDLPPHGMARAHLYDKQEGLRHHARNVFAAALRQRFPLLPIEAADRLHTMGRREHFIERVLAYACWTRLLALPPAPTALVQFHNQHKLTLMAHSREHYQTLGSLVAQADSLSMASALNAYGNAFMACLNIKATPRKHANVLYHLLGHLKRQLDTADKQEVITCIEQYRQGLMPLLVPLTLLRHHFRRYPVSWVLAQTYMSPYPAEMMLRYHA